MEEPPTKDGANMKRTRLKRAGKRTRLHQAVCRGYRQKLFNEHGYLFCELCKRSDRQYSTHHVIPASKAPSHPNLHDDINLICLCYECHDKIERFELGDERETLIRERGLEKLFNGGGK